MQYYYTHKYFLYFYAIFIIFILYVYFIVHIVTVFFWKQINKKIKVSDRKRMVFCHTQFYAY